jgi:hypothetical protein
MLLLCTTMGNKEEPERSAAPPALPNRFWLEGLFRGKEDTAPLSDSGCTELPLGKE